MTDIKSKNHEFDRIAAEIRDLRLDDETVASATDRVWRTLQAEHGVGLAPLRSCADVQALLPAYVGGELPEARALLVGDHTRECLPCRRALLVLRSGGAGAPPTSAPVRPPLRFPQWLKAAAAILLMAGGGAVAFLTGGNLVADRRLSARIASTDGSLQLVTDHSTDALAAGDTIRARQRVRTTKESGAFLSLDDGSMVEMAPRSEIVLRGSRHGTTIELGHGNIIVHAAEQGRDRLAVTTDECRVAVKGTIFAVNHGLKGSRVSVIEGEVEVRHGSSWALLFPGEQVTTDDRLRRVSVEDEIAWSVNADEHRELLRELTRLQHAVADAVDVATPRTSTRLLDLVPADTVVYLAMPNLTDGLGAARQVFSSRMADSEVLRDWWQREIVDRNIDTQIEESLDRLQFLGAAVGDEVVVALPASVLSTGGAPLVLAELENPQAFRGLLDEHLAGHPDGPPPVRILDDPWAAVDPGAEVLIWISDDLVVAGHTPEAIRAVAARLDGSTQGRFAGTDLHQRLADRYARGVEWLVGVDLQRAFTQATATTTPDEAALIERFGLLDATTLVFERRRAETGSSIDAEVRFSGARRGIAAWLAEPAPLPTLDFVSADAYLVSAAASKDGLELFDELLAMVAAGGPGALTELESFQQEIGIDLREDLAAAIGGEGTFALDGPVLPIPTWKLVLEVYDPVTLQHTIERVVARANTELRANGTDEISIRIEEIGGLSFTTLRHPSSPLGFTYTMTEGFLVAGSNRAAVEQALAVRRSGMGLTRSATFRELLPANGFTDCSALIYRNLSSIVGVLPAGSMGAELGGYEELLRDSAAPGLFCVYGLADRILVSGSGPSLVGLAPILGLPGLMALGGDATIGRDPLSSPE